MRGIETKRPAASAERLPFVVPLQAASVQSLPEGDAWLYEVKFDGYRCLASRDSDGVRLWSRRGNLFTKDFPEIARACEKLPADTIVDAEVVALIQNGRI